MLQNIGGPELGAPGEDGSGVSEQAREQSEQASQQFQAQQAAGQQAQREEQKARKRDDGVVAAIVQFLTDSQRTHLSVLIARLVSLNCPSAFILAILSLINDGCLQAVDEYLQEHGDMGTDIYEKANAILQASQFDAAATAALVDWMGRLQLTLSRESDAILTALKTPDNNLDGTVLQLSTFVLQEFFKNQGRTVPFEKVHPLAAGILQTVFEPYF